MTAAKLNIDELEAGYPLFCKALRLLILKGNSLKEIERTVCWGHLETLNRCLPGRHLFNVSRCPQQTVLSISLSELPFKINNLRALQNKG